MVGDSGMLGSLPLRNRGRESVAVAMFSTANCVAKRIGCCTAPQLAKKCPPAPSGATGPNGPGKSRGTSNRYIYTNVSMLSIGGLRQVTGLFRQHHARQSSGNFRRLAIQYPWWLD